MTLSESELTAMRTAINDLLPDTCLVLSATTASDGQGGWSQTWGTAYAALPCRLDQRTAFETDAGGARQAFSYWLLTLPYDTDIEPENRVKVGGTTFSVVSVDVDKSWGTCVRCKVDKV